MRTAFSKVAVLTIFIGVIGFSLNIIFASQNGYVPITYISERTVNGITFYHYDFWNYVENIRNTIQSVSQMSIAQPTRVWMDMQEGVEYISYNMLVLQNNLILILDWMVLGINILIYPIRLVFYVIQIILSLVGVPVLDQNGAAYQSNISWLIQLINWGKAVQLPYM